MSEVQSCAEIGGQHAELLPARTVMSMFMAGDGGQGAVAGDTAAPAAAPAGGDGNLFNFLFSFAGKLVPMK